MAFIIVAHRKRIKRFIFWFFLVGLIITGLRFRRELGRVFFPLPYRETIIKNARANAIDPAVIAAVIYVESGFNPRAVSSRGAVGLMQVMPETGRWVGSRAGRPEIDEKALFSHETNIYIGSWYLRYLLDQLNQDLVLALAAYNAGWNRVRDWRRQEIWSGKLDELERIPFPETRRYVRRVLWYYRIYRYLYPEVAGRFGSAVSLNQRMRCEDGTSRRFYLPRLR